MKRRFLALFLMVCLVLSCVGCGQDAQENEPTKKPEQQQPTTALTINGHDLSPVELNYFYFDTINEYVKQYGNYLPWIGLNPSIPLSEQVYEKTDGTTWADYFLSMASDSAKNVYALYDAAIAAGHSLNEEEISAKQALYDNMDVYAGYYGYKNADEYLQAIYGVGAVTKSYQAYYEVILMASSYYSAYSEQLKDSYDDVALRDFEGDEGYKYNSYTYYTHYMDLDKFKFGGTMDSSGKIVYSEDEIKAAEAYIERVSKELANPENNTPEKLNAAINATEEQLELDKTLAQSKATTSSNPTYSKVIENKDKLYSSISTLMQEWIRDSARKEGDITFLKKTTSTTDQNGKQVDTLNGYYIVLFQSVNDNVFPLANVRHILVKFEGGTTNVTTGQKEYTDAEKGKAKEEAEKIYNEWLNGAKTEESFAELAKKYTDDGNGDVGGIYYDIYPGQMVATFNDWCFGDRQPGDHGIVETEYGYHVMFYSGDSQTNYRNFMVSNDKLSADMEAWQKGLMDATTLEIINTDSVNKDYIISPSETKE